MTLLWQAATPGQATLSGHANQFLIGHSSTLNYGGSAVNTIPGLSGTADQLGSGALAFAFTVGSTTSLTHINLALGAIGAGADALVSLQAQSGSVPSGTPLVAAVVPAEWLASGVQSAASAWNIPLNYTLAALTQYYIVVQPGSALLGSGAYAQGAAGVDDVELTRSTAGSGALTYNPSTSTWTAQSYGYGAYLYGGVSGVLVGLADDPNPLVAFTLPSKVSAYNYNSNSQITGAYEWTMRSLGATFNMLCRDDASFESGLGTWVAQTNCAIAQSATHALDGSESMRMTASSAATMSAKTSKGTFPATYYPVAASTTYTAAASFYPGSTTRAVQVAISWYTSAGALISTSTGATVNETAATWTQAFVTGASPSNAAYALVVAQVVSPANAEVHYVDCAGLFAGSSAVWSYPGTGVATKRTLGYGGASGYVLTGVS